MLYHTTLLFSLSAFAGSLLPEKPLNLVPDLKVIPSSQQQLDRGAALGNRNAQSLARNLGNRSIGNGARHIRHGRAAHNPPEVKVGYVELVQGILGLLASAVAGDLAKKDEQNVAMLDAVNGTGALAAPPVSEAARDPGSQLSVGASGASNSPLARSKALMRELVKDEDTKEALVALEADHGISREVLIDAMAQGKSERDILAGAPLNPFSMEEFLEAQAKAREKSASEASKLAASQLLPAPAGVAPAKAEDSAASLRAGRSNLRGALARSLASVGEADELEVSDDIKAALAAQEAEKLARERERNSLAELDLFSVVHMKYVEREKNLRWGEPLRTAEK